MSRKLFSDKEVRLLAKNKYVVKVSDKAITYSFEFKKKFVEEYNKGKLPRVIFEEADFDIEILGMKRVETVRKRWRKAFKENGELGLKDSRKEKSGRPLERKLSDSEKIKRLEAQIKYLEIEKDQGFHYTNPKFQALLYKNNIGQSMSRKGNCWDNAPMESFFGHMKDEINLKPLKTLDEVKREIERYMKYYNNNRY